MGGVSLRARGQTARASSGHAWTLDDATDALTFPPDGLHATVVVNRK